MHTFPKRKLYFPAFSIILVIALLLVIIGISTHRNWNRERQRGLDYLHSQGLTIIRTLEAGARSGMMMHMWGEDSLESLIQEMGGIEDVLYIYLYDEQGRITHHSDPSQKKIITEWHPILEGSQQIARRIKRDNESSVTYEMAKKYTPINTESNKISKFMHDQGMMSHSHAGDILVLGLNMAKFEAYQREDLRHSIVMGSILLVLGSGVAFFIFVIQNYYLVNRGLKASQDFNRLVVHSMADGLMSIDKDGKLITYNRQALSMLSITEKEAADKNLSTILDFDSTGIQDALTSKKSFINREISYLKKPNDIITIGLTVSPLSADEENSLGAVLVLRDLTQVKQLAEQVRQAEKLATVGSLAARVAHEIRNPLGSIRGFAQLFQQRFKDRPQDQEYAAVMVREIDRINDVVSDLLSLARPATIDRKPTQMVDLLQHTHKLVAGDARSHQVVVDLKIGGEFPPLKMDGNQISQALLNLLINALEATPPGGRIVFGARLDSRTRNLVLWVEDNGPGIAQEDSSRIFEPFFTTRQNGTGLGLAVVSNIVTSHGGKIQVQSPPPDSNKGCRISLLLPINDDGDDE